MHIFFSTMEVATISSLTSYPQRGRHRPWQTRLTKKASAVVVSASKPGAAASFKPVSKGCRTCSGKGAIECPGCKGTGKNKKNGNIFERWKCYDCQGFGLKSCPNCGTGGLTPEQRGER